MAAAYTALLLLLFPSSRHCLACATARLMCNRRKGALADCSLMRGVCFANGLSSSAAAIVLRAFDAA